MGPSVSVQNILSVRTQLAPTGVSVSQDTGQIQPTAQCVQVGCINMCTGGLF